MQPASRKITPPQYFEEMNYPFEKGRVPEIIAVMQQAIRPEVAQQVRLFAQDFPPTRRGLQKLWDWVTANIQYVEDGEIEQIIQYPARLNVTKKGDCKSLSLFVASVLACWKCDFTLMYVHYTDTDSNHVYPIAHTAEGDIIVDTVWKKFDSQKEPFKIIRKQKYRFK